jgi:SAM-dependent methyltransferase
MDLDRLVRGALGKLVLATLSDPESGEIRRILVRPLTLGGARRYQFESRRGPKAFHRNLGEEEAARELSGLLGRFRQTLIQTEDSDIRIAHGRATTRPASRPPAALGHDRERDYLLPEGRPVEFLVRLGVMSPQGVVRSAKQGKFRQMNRYLEFVSDVVGELPRGRVRVVDFGCGKSYLTFALHHFLRDVRGIDAEIVGLDLKEDVVQDCARIARDLRLEGLRFETGDIAGFEGFPRADLVVSLHACDTATDQALARAVGWGSKVILAVPCCQHEVARSIASDVQEPLLRHGILRERLASLVTDALRAELLEISGYSVQVLEFIDTEHTPKNLMIRAVRRGPKKSDAAYRRLRDAWSAVPALEKLLPGETAGERGAGRPEGRPPRPQG